MAAKSRKTGSERSSKRTSHTYPLLPQRVLLTGARMLPAGQTPTPSVSVPTSEDKDIDTDFETYLLLLLSDSNLPTGGFVASSGLESFHAHGLLNHASAPSAPATLIGSSQRSVAPSQAQLSAGTLSFAQSTLHSYARSSFPLLARTHARVTEYLDTGARAHADRKRAPNGEGEGGEAMAQQMLQQQETARLSECLRAVSRLDDTYHTLLLNHVARRASKAQGVALLTLYSKAFARPVQLSSSASCSIAPDTDNARIELAANLVDAFKLAIRRSSLPSTSTTSQRQIQHGHLPICWGVFSACLGISLKKSVYLHLFLQARALFSSSIRLNTLGPYLAHQVMRFQMRGVVEGIIMEMEREGCIAPLPPVLMPADDSTAESKETQEMEVDDDPPAYTIDESFTAAKGKAPAEGKPFRTTPSMSTSTTVLRPKVQALRIGKGKLIPVDDQDESQGWAWDWPEDQDPFHDATEGKGDSERGFWSAFSAPATTYPLGEIVQARHDQLHSRLFNS